MKIKLTVELIVIAVFALTAVCHALNLFQTPFWVYLIYSAAYLIFEITGFNDTEL